MDEILAGDIYTLTDAEPKEEQQYENVGVAELSGKRYVAIVPAEEEVEEYGILRVDTDDNGDTLLSSIEDDDEWETVAACFDNEIFKDIDYDEDSEK